MRLESVLEAIRTSDLALNPGKCSSAHKELKCQCHLVNADEILPGPAETSTKGRFLRSKHKKGVRKFLGVCAYYRRFVKNFAGIAKSLTCLTEKRIPLTGRKPNRKHSTNFNIAYMASCDRPF